MVKVCASVSAVLSLAACTGDRPGDVDDSDPPGTSADSGTTDLQPVDPAPERPPQASIDGVEGLSVALAWTSSDGHEQFDPETRSSIDWPIGNLGQGRIVLATHVSPVEATVRWFPEVPSSGIPDSEPRVEDCEFSPEGDSIDNGPDECTVWCDSDACYLEYAVPDDIEPKLLIAEFRWFVAPDLREEVAPEAPPTNSLSVGWAAAGAGD